MVENIKLQVVLQVIPYLLVLHVILVLARGLVGKLQLVPRGVALVRQVITAPVLGLVGNQTEPANQGMVVHPMVVVLQVQVLAGLRQLLADLIKLFPVALVFVHHPIR